MRPVNLIPAEDRRGDQAPLRTGPLVYIVIGALVVLLAGVAVLVLTDNEISERKDEVATLKREDAVASARAARLASYTQFQAASEQRVATVQSLADSRFDWERVLRELSLILPSDVSLSELSASGSGESAGGSGSGSGLNGGIAGPFLEMTGCAAGQEGVAGFITALKDIDGVTRVGVQASEDVGEAGGAESGECAVGGATTQFVLVVAFDAAPVPLPEGETEVAPEAAPEAAQAASSETSESSSSEAEGG
jgi:Tfp pilus assembly protein PilN